MSGYQNYKFVLNKCLFDSFQLPDFSTENIVIYEVVKLMNQKILFLEDHLQRFFDSFRYTNLNCKLTEKEIIQQLKLLISSNNVSNGNIKFHVNIHSLTEKQDFYAYFIPHSYPTAEQYENGVPVSIVRALRQNPNAKVQRTELKQQVESLLDKEKTYEAILINQDGTVTEGSRSNLFMIKNNQIYTAKDKDILPGITRKYILQLCQDLHLPIHLQTISSDELPSMNAMFLSGTSPKVLPVNSIYEYKFDVQHPILRKIMKQFDEVIENNLQLNSEFCE